MDEYSYQAVSRIETLKERTKRCVCKYCGEPLRLRRIIFSDFEEARVEIFCDNCDMIEYGVEPEIYRNAKYFVEVLGFNCYPYFDENERTKRMNIAKVCEIMTWGDKNLGILSDDGFQVPIKIDHSMIGEMLFLTDQELDED